MGALGDNCDKHGAQDANPPYRADAYGRGLVSS